MPRSSQPKIQATRRPVLRFELEQVSLDNRPNAYKKPQLVLKPQLELPPRETFTGSQSRGLPLWHHFLMVHVKDKADELVKIDLNDFKEPQNLSKDYISPHSVSCLLSEASIVFRYPYGPRNIPTSLQITLKKPSDFEAVLSELRKLDIRIAYEHLNPQNISSSNLSSSGFPPEFDRNQFSMSRQIHNISPAPTASTSSQDQHFSHSGFEMDGYAIERPSNQSARLLDRQYWSPVVAPSKSTATIGNPGVLGEPGLYKISRVGSSSSSRLRARPPSIPLEQPRLRTYAPADQLHRILERREPFLPRRQTNETAFGQADQLSPEFGQTDHQLRTQNQMLPPRRFSRIPNLGGAFESTRRPAMQRLDPILDEPETASGYTQLNEQNMDHGFSQPLSAPQNLPLVRREVGDLYHSQLEPSSRETRQAPDTLQLMQISQIHHQGFVKAHGVWTDFMERAENATKSIDNPEEALKIISKLEEEFTEQWDRAVASTIQEMQKVGALK